MDLRGGRRRFWRRKLVAVAGRPVAGRPNQVTLCNFLERRKRKGVGNFLVETRVDELCSLPSKWK